MQKAPSAISTSGHLSEAGSQFKDSDTSSPKSAPLFRDGIINTLRGSMASSISHFLLRPANAPQNNGDEVKYWSYSRQTWRPYTSMEGGSLENWIPVRRVEQTGLGIRPHSWGRPYCRGVPLLVWHPRESIKVVEEGSMSRPRKTCLTWSLERIKWQT